MIYTLLIIIINDEKFCFLTNSQREQMDTILQTTFSNAFRWIGKVWLPINLQLKYVLYGLIDNKPALVHKTYIWAPIRNSKQEK